MVTFTAFNEGKVELAKGNINFATDTIKVALLESAYTPDIDTQSNFSDISANESSGTNYTAGGNTVANITVTKDNANDRAVIGGDNVTFTDVSISYQYMVLYKDTGTASTSTLIGYADRGSSITISADDVQVNFDAVGIGVLN